MAREPDPRSELTRLERALAQGGAPPRGCVLRGPEAYFRDRALRAVKEAARAAGFELCQHDAGGSDFHAPGALDDLVGGALFASKRCVVIENAEDRLKKDMPLTRAVLSFLDGDRGTVVLAARSLRADNVAVKAIAKAGGEVLTFRKFWDAPPPWEKSADPRRTELVAWVVGRARELGCRLTPERALLLTKRTGNELEVLEGALASLAAGDDPDFDVLGGETAAGSPFQVADDLVAGDTGAALAGIETLFRGGMKKDKDGTREQGTGALIAILMGTVRGRVREGLLVAEAMEGGQSLEAAFESLGMRPSPMVRRRLAEQVAARSAGTWRRMLEEALGLERRGRSGAALDAADLAELALRWRRKRAPAR